MTWIYLMVPACILGLIGCSDAARQEADARVRTTFGAASAAADREEWAEASKFLGEITPKDYPRKDDQFADRVAEMRRVVDGHIAETGSIDELKALIKKEEWVQAVKMMESLTTEGRLGSKSIAEVDRLRAGLRVRLGEVYVHIRGMVAAPASVQTATVAPPSRPTTIDSTGRPYRPDISAQAADSIIKDMIKQGRDPAVANAFVTELFRAEAEHQRKMDESFNRSH